MKERINKLAFCLRAEYFSAWALVILLVASYELGIMTEGAYAGNAKMDYILQTIGILLVIAMIPTSVKLFSLSITQYIKNLPLTEALKSYRRWSEVRLSLLFVAALLNISFYYMTMNTTGALCAAMALVASLFCIPDKKRLLKELDLEKEEVEENEI